MTTITATTATEAPPQRPPYTGALELFLNSIGSKETRQKYRNKLDAFLKFAGMTGSSLPEKAQAFVDRASKDNPWAFGCMLVSLCSRGKGGSEKR
ncbi:MAG: hypothetical protein C4292_01560 [Nitrososphaera sp.]